MIFYLVNVDYSRQTGEDNPGRVKESYLVDAPTPSDAERVVLEEIKSFVFGDCTTSKIQKVQFFDVFDKNELGGSYWYKAKVEMIIVDGERETRKVINILVQGEKIIDANGYCERSLLGYDCDIISISRTPIIDILKMEELL